ncbi:phosphate ABC transporter permease PstA [Bermanella marisrubri]|uniref:Phosphate transport system permease protein PstA n=1 Tax=Bermanella marisrubri TaxID=207949 RepID=Q1N3Y3_9GAMM|nr:phosphate ABC transporter permease PstA [Bermanella marisrubri]EAT13082.1 phosphate ABC transporter, permease protein PtsA [Oceanobacter sp. RED65] [Bermanella marisrubri]QIZ82802.1 phosphate ABC transporter permease PstA [Bermanella marisrubri]
MRVSFKEWVQSGSPFIWLNAGAVAISMIMVLGLIGFIAVKGLAHFWPGQVMQATYTLPGNAPTQIMGQISDREMVGQNQLQAIGLNTVDGADEAERILLKVGNRDVYGGDFRWVLAHHLSEERFPDDAMVIERREWGNFYGFLQKVYKGDELVGDTQQDPQKAWDEFQALIQRALDLHDEIMDIQKGDIGAINYEIDRLRLKERGYELEGELTQERLDELNARRDELNAEYDVLQKKLMDLNKALKRDHFIVTEVNGQVVELHVSEVVRAFKPNQIGIVAKVGHYFAKMGEFLGDDPREANTEGGVFPAIFGTVLMVILMAIMVTPLGVIAAVYLREYAKQGALTRVIRIAVNNLAGVPSIVYGVFGLGFFVYFLGGTIDELFFPEALPSPTFGTSGLLWASITLALLTLPVVIVATEEGLARIPRTIREGSLALGATKWETLVKIILPMSSPAMMTGVILAVARAAGEVAPLMLVGVVKLAPTLPLNTNYPYLHLDQKFMHLGFHIYDVGFQSPNVEAARPLVYATALLLVLVIALLNLSAIAIRNHLREKYKALEM